MTALQVGASPQRPAITVRPVRWELFVTITSGMAVKLTYRCGGSRERAEG